MLDWLRRDPFEEPMLTVGDCTLPVEVRCHAKAKRMTLRLSPDGKAVRVTIPRWGRIADALDFADSRSDWLARQLAALPEAEPLCAGGSLPYRGAPLTIEHRADAPRKPVVADGLIRLGGPEASLAKRLKRWLESEARLLLSGDLADYCATARKEAPRLALSSARRRWGSCAPDGSIRINWRLVMAPDFVRRSVVAHEVAHLVHFDHSPQFHALLAELFEGDIAKANSWLKHEGRGLYLPFG